MKNQGLIDENGYILETSKISESLASQSNSSEKNKKKIVPKKLNKNNSTKEFLRTIRQLELWKEPKNRNLNVVQAVKNYPVPSNKKISSCNFELFFGKKKLYKNKLKPIVNLNKSSSYNSSN